MKLTDLIQDSQNANKGTERGAEIVRKSLEKLGAGRSVLIDRTGVLIAGNKTAKAAIEAGLGEAIVIDSDGKQLVVVRRTDLDLSSDAAAKELAIVDNRASEVGLEWDASVLAAIGEEVELGDWFEDEELEDLIGVVPDFEPVGEDEQGRLDQIEPKEISCTCPQCGHEFIKQY